MRYAVALALLCLPSLPAAAADAERGLALAERWCRDCHVVSPAAGGGDAGPPLATIAVEEPASARAARAWLFDPHGAMEQIELAPGDIADILAHIRHLRAEAAQ